MKYHSYPHEQPQQQPRSVERTSPLCAIPRPSQLTRDRAAGISDSFYLFLHSGTISSAIYVGSLMVCGGSREQMSIEQTSTEDIRTQLLSN